MRLHSGKSSSVRSSVNANNLEMAGNTATGVEEEYSEWQLTWYPKVFMHWALKDLSKVIKKCKSYPTGVVTWITGLTFLLCMIFEPKGLSVYLLNLLVNLIIDLGDRFHTVQRERAMYHPVCNLNTQDWYRSGAYWKSKGKQMCRVAYCFSLGMQLWYCYQLMFHFDILQFRKIFLHRYNPLINSVDK